MRRDILTMFLASALAVLAYCELDPAAPADDPDPRTGAEAMEAFKSDPHRFRRVIEHWEGIADDPWNLLTPEERLDAEKTTREFISEYEARHGAF